MKRTGLRMLGVFGLLSASALAVPIVGLGSDGGPNILKDSDEKTLPGGAPSQVVSTGGITFNLYYLDVINDTNNGFDGPNATKARARVTECLTYIASVLHESGTLDVLVNESQMDASGFLASCGTYYPLTNGFQTGSTMSRLHDPGDAKPFSDTEEITMVVDFGFPWNFDGNPAAVGEVDFQTVLLHEMTHGLGFSSLSSSSGASQFAPNKIYTQFDTFLNRRTGSVQLFSGNPPTFNGVAGDLNGQNLAWAGDEGVQAYLPNAAPGIYAPSSFAPGSSLSHWNTGNIIDGAVMEHSVSLGETRREYAPIDLGALRDIGYLNANDVSGEGEGEGEPGPCELDGGCPDLDAQGGLLIAVLVGATLLPPSANWYNVDVDGGGILDSYEAALVRAVICGSTTLGTDPICIFDENLATVQTESAYSLIGDTRDDVVAGLASIGTEMQAALAGFGLAEDYTAVAEAAKAAGEPLSPSGDPDGDGLTNLEEYNNVIADSGSAADYVAAALNPLLDGSATSANSLPVAGVVGFGAALGLLLTTAAAALRRKRD